MKKVVVLLSLFTFVLSLNSCVSTKTVATWEKEEIQPVQYKKLLVYCDAPSFASRSVVERKVAKEFTSYGLSSVTASDKLPKFSIDSVKNVQSLISSSASLGVDVFLHITLGGTSESIVSNTSTNMLDNKVSTSNYRVAYTKVENKLIDAKTGTLVMSIDTETNAHADVTNVEDVAGSLARELHSQLDGVAITFK